MQDPGAPLAPARGVNAETADDGWESVEREQGREEPPEDQAADEEQDEEAAAEEGAQEEQELFPRDPSRMELTEEETEWAKAIKTAVEASNEIDNLSDFMYAQYALIDQDNVQQALRRIQHFQIFRQEYRLLDTADEGTQILHRLVGLLTNIMLSVSFNQEEGNFVLVMDIAAFREKNLKTDADYRYLLGFVYYIGHVLSPDFTAIRQGTFYVIECDGYDWKNLTMSTRRRLWTESLAVYPYRIQQIKYFHTGIYANMAAALMKRFLPVEVYSNIAVGCQFAGRLDTFYAVPTRELANERFLRRTETCLIARYENIRDFRLPSS